MNTIKDLENELRKITTDYINLDHFIDINLRDSTSLVKSGNIVILTNYGYACSKCNGELSEEESNWVYCPNCIHPLDCCEKINAPCDRCGPEAYNLIVKTYKLFAPADGN